MTKLEESSKTTYKSNLKALNMIIKDDNDTDEKDLDYIIRHSVDVIKKLRESKKNGGESYSENYIKNILCTILSEINRKFNVSKNDQSKLPKDLIEHYKNFDEYYNYYDAILDDKKHEMSDKQKEGYIPLEDIIKKRDELEKIDSGSKEHLFLSMYTYIDPLRQDFNDVKIFKKLNE